MLKKMSKYRNATGDEYPSRAYDNAAKSLTSIRALDSVIAGVNMPKGIGKKIREVIIEFVSTGRVNELIELRDNPQVAALEKFEKVMGIGPVNALKFVDMGYTSLEELRKYPHLTKQQKIGIDLHDKIMLRVPRATVTQVFDVLRGMILTVDKSSDSIVSGSYRRGASTSGDVDILVRSDTISAKTIVANVEKTMKDAIIVVSAGDQKAMFLYKLPGGAYIQVDIFVCKSDEYIAHLNYSTGSASHNIKVRKAAIKKGYKLSQHGLFKGTKKIKLSTERELYDLVGIPYSDPTSRND